MDRGENIIFRCFTNICWLLKGLLQLRYYCNLSNLLLYYLLREVMYSVITYAVLLILLDVEKFPFTCVGSRLTLIAVLRKV